MTRLPRMDAGDVDRLRRLLAADPALAHARTNLDPPYHYFTGATLLHHVAGNPDRGRLDGTSPPLPANSPEIARVLLDAGADVQCADARPARRRHDGAARHEQAGQRRRRRRTAHRCAPASTEPGSTCTSDGCLDGSLANHAPRAAEKMIALGAQPDVLAAAALGRMDLLRTFFDGDGRLLSRPRRRNKEMAERDAIGLALLYAYVREQREAVDFLLEKDGNWDMIGVNNGAVLHRAAFIGDLEMVKRLVAKGADIGNRDNPFNSTPLGWADHNKQAEVMQWMRAHCAIDLHDAVAFDFREHIEARLREDPASVDKRIDHWDIPQATALHTAAAMGHEDAARLLLENGADANIVAGNGLTPLDVAEANDASGVAALLEQRGAARAAGSRPKAPAPKLEHFEALASDILVAYQSGEPSALERMREFFKRTFSWSELRARLPERLGKPAGAELSLDDIRGLVAHLRGFSSWVEFARSVIGVGGRAKPWNLPLYRIEGKHRTMQVRHSLEEKEWDEILAAMADQKISSLDAGGQMTDAVLARLAELRSRHAAQLRRHEAAHR